MTKRITTRDISQMALFVALMAVCSWITIPLPWVPITMQVFGVFLALCAMGGQKGTVCVFTYILLGAVGAPVFSGFRGGIGVLLGTTGGYIVGFIPMAMLFWLLTAVIRREHPAIRFSIMVLCLAVCYAFGTAWYVVAYMNQTGAIGVGTALMRCVVPFIAPDTVKILLAMCVAARIRKLGLIPNR